MNGVTYLRYEVIRNFRNWRFVVFSLAWPLLLFFTIASVNRHSKFDGISFPVYFMTAMTAMGAMIAVVASGARIALERAAGWTRQLRLTPLSVRGYFRAKVLCAYLMALLTIVALCLAGLSLGVRLPADGWFTVIGLMLVGLVPFAVLGILFGHLLRSDSLNPVVGGITTAFALLGGAYGFQLATSGWLFDLTKVLPSYWLVQAGKTALGGHGWPAEGWIVIAAWTAVLVPLAVLAYRRDSGRV